MKIQNNFADSSESSFAEMRAVVSVAIKRGWIHFPVERSALVRRGIAAGWIIPPAPAPATLNPKTPAKSALSAKRR